MLAGDPIPPRRGREMPPGFSELAEMVDDFVKGEKVNLFTDMFFSEEVPNEREVVKRMTDEELTIDTRGGFTPRPRSFPRSYMQRRYERGWLQNKWNTFQSKWWAVRLIMIIWTAAFLVGLPYITYLMYSL